MVTGRADLPKNILWLMTTLGQGFRRGTFLATLKMPQYSGTQFVDPVAY